MSVFLQHVTDVGAELQKCLQSKAGVECLLYVQEPWPAKKEKSPATDAVHMKSFCIIQQLLPFTFLAALSLTITVLLLAKEKISKTNGAESYHIIHY